MTPVERKNYFSTIQAQLESKNVVTFKWLSRKFKIHCTTAKQLLNEFLNESDSKKYSVTYIVFSKGADGCLKISLSNENDLNISDDSTVVDKQIYSIECSSSDISTDDLYTDDKLTFQLEQMNLSSINYPMKVGKKLDVRRLNSSTSTDVKNFNEEKVKKSSSFSQKVEPEIEKKNFTDEKVEKSGSSSRKVESNKEKVNKLNFTALPKSKNEEKYANKIENKSKKSPVKTETESKVSNVKTSKPPATTKGSLSALFQNHRVKSTSCSGGAASKKDENSEMTIEDSESEEKHDCSEAVEEKRCGKNQSAKPNSTAKASKEKKPTKKSTTKSKKKPEKKKRKRITMFESSSDESASDGELSEKESAFNQFDEEPEPEPEPEKPVEPEPNTSFVLGKKRKRKVISKMAVGDDGFFYTDKQVVYESCDSDDNDENDPNANQEPNKRLKANETENSASKTSAVSPTAEKSNAKNQKAKTKQASIMNFFKKS